eukprot:CAMPEP_0181439632 /NCGR_PEP_ID=MMETSP1110-20121109/22533_1 /TAXON_ID=174948 /ORGANISM="Symbiodinium sp., Strain CCMP421" /LENGTH=54 /DNA_ID=CAMNT_0023563373 /DNA_START=58 /DNA_END=219 /DNA_ORIENTATION=-
MTVQPRRLRACEAMRQPQVFKPAWPHNALRLAIGRLLAGEAEFLAPREGPQVLS